MSFSWGRTFYAKWHGMIFNFEQKMDRDYFVAHADGGSVLSASDAWKEYGQGFIRVYASSGLESSKTRQKRIKEWRANR